MMRGCSAVRNASRALRVGPAPGIHLTTTQASCLRCRNASPRSMARGKASHVALRSISSSPSRPFHTSTPALEANASPSPNPEPTDTVPEQLRSVMRILTHPVVVCTARDASTSTPRGMTMSSFTSLSLADRPLVTFNVATPSRTLDAIRQSGVFNIHVLAGDGTGAMVAENFTRGNMEGIFDRLVGARCKTLETAADGAREKNLGPPVLEGDGVLYVLRCRVVGGEAPEGGLMQVRDHVIVVGEVLEVVEGGRGEEFGLAYTDRRYRGVGGVIAKH